MVFKAAFRLSVSVRLHLIAYGYIFIYACIWCSVTVKSSWKPRNEKKKISIRRSVPLRKERESSCFLALHQTFTGMSLQRLHNEAYVSKV